MDSYRKTAIIVGVLFIIATVTAILSIVFLGSTLETPLNFDTVSSNANQVIIAVIFWLILAVSVTGIGVMMYPILKKHNEGLALGYTINIKSGIYRRDFGCYLLSTNRFFITGITRLVL